ncbi:MAG: PDZ domain-containing protein [Gemmatimonadetes bacterium]|nr:PDZ domain-containing protein [Gemmatimonadota bacterium]
MRNIFAALLLALVAVATSHAQSVVRTPRAGTSYTLSTMDDRDRAMLGIATSTGGRRDTLGLMISSVTAAGPAEKAGLEEGNRILSINGVSLKLSRDDADDEEMPAINQNRLTRVMRTVKAADLPGGETSGFRFGTGETGGMRMIGPGTNGSVRIIRPDGAMNFDTNVHVMPRIRINRGGMEDDVSYDLEEGLGKLREIGPQIRKQIEEGLPRDLGPQIRRQIEGGMKSRVTVRSVNRVIL